MMKGMMGGFDGFGWGDVLAHGLRCAGLFGGLGTSEGVASDDALAGGLRCAGLL